MVPTMAMSTAGLLVMPKRATTGYDMRVCEAYIDAISSDTAQSRCSRYTLASVPIAIGSRKVSKPKQSPRRRFSRRWNISISRPARNIKYSRPT